MRARAPIPVEARPNARWSRGFVHDQFTNAQHFRVLNVVGNVTRECLGSPQDSSISERRVARDLIALIERWGKPGMIVSDNGTDLISNAILRRCSEKRIEWHSHRARKAHAEGVAESVTGRMRDDPLNETMCHDLAHARVVIAAGATDYDTERPYSALDDQTPADDAPTLTAAIARRCCAT
ncbi:integrase-like protein [Rhodovulum kholense]|uniref:Integrase-like protein n=1 Tax=Rhodovulum kholense TaxID=453584 RepID=A0A8E2VKC8_9RHOB|nr:integrase-like protein [Rhodovulum kholense]